jgi:hypothetical protein
MAKIATIVLATVLLSGAARAQAPAAAGDAATMRDFLTGTLEIDNPAGAWSAKRWFAPDHTYRETGSDGQVHGVWTIENGKICTARDKPVTDPDRTARYCNEGLGRHTGDKWRDVDPVTGNAVFFSLTAGR